MLKAQTVVEGSPSPSLNAAVEPASDSGPCVYELTVVAPTFNERGNVTALISRLRDCLEGVAWQVIFVDDDSPDGTAELVKTIAASDPRVQCLRRVGRRGLAGAVVEGVLASAAPYVAVIDADLQHDETLLPTMLAAIKADRADLVIASRYVGSSGADVEGLSPIRQLGSQLANGLGRRVLRQEVSDPVSGFFMIRRELVERVAPKLTTEGFKILFDVIASQPEPLRILEQPYVFREREAGGSKLDSRIVIDYFGLLISKLSGGVLPTRALMFGLVGATGVVIHLCVLRALLLFGYDHRFVLAQFLAAVIAMTSNYLINNEITYRDRRRRGFGLLLGYLKFCGLCSVGLAANVAVASMVHSWAPDYPLIDGAAGAGFGAVWNYLTTSMMVW